MRIASTSDPAAGAGDTPALRSEHSESKAGLLARRGALQARLTKDVGVRLSGSVSLSDTLMHLETATRIFLKIFRRTLPTLEECSVKYF